MAIIQLTIKSGGNTLTLYFSSLAKLRANNYFNTWMQNAHSRPWEYEESGSIMDQETIYIVKHKKYSTECLEVKWIYCE